MNEALVGMTGREGREVRGRMAREEQAHGLGKWWAKDQHETMASKKSLRTAEEQH